MVEELGQPDGHASPEAASLASWRTAPSARPRVVTVDVRGDRAEVVIETASRDREWSYCLRRGTGWHSVSARSAPLVGWDDPGVLD